MNFKERGITIGDLILVIIFIFSTIFIINKFKESDKQAYIQMTESQILNVRKF